MRLVARPKPIALSQFPAQFPCIPTRSHSHLPEGYSPAVRRRSAQKEKPPAEVGSMLRSRTSTRGLSLPAALKATAKRRLPAFARQADLEGDHHAAPRK
jgi:hypothetical protein